MTEIRKATAADAEKILEYSKIAGGETDNLTFGAEGIFNMTVEREQEYLEKIYNSQKDLYLIALDNGEIVGSSYLSAYQKARLAHRAEIGLSVKKDMWGKGIGTRFMEKLLDFAKNTAKAEVVSLEVRSDNERAIALYRKFGFETIGTFKGFMKINGEYIDCDIMEIFLN